MTVEESLDPVSNKEFRCPAQVEVSEHESQYLSGPS